MRFSVLNKRAGWNFAQNTKKTMAVLFMKREILFTLRQDGLSPMSQINISYQKINLVFAKKIPKKA